MTHSEVVVFDRPDLPFPYWRSYLRALLGVPVLHLYVSMPTGLNGPLEDHSYDWYFTLAFKDRTSLVDPVLLKGAIEPSNLELLLNPSLPH